MASPDIFSALVSSAHSAHFTHTFVLFFWLWRWFFIIIKEKCLIFSLTHISFSNWIFLYTHIQDGKDCERFEELTGREKGRIFLSSAHERERGWKKECENVKLKDARNEWDKCMHACKCRECMRWNSAIFPPTQHSSLSSNEFECIFNFNCSSQTTTKDSAGNRERGVDRMLKCFSLGKIKWKLICEFFLSLFSFFIASLVFNQHWQKRRENLHFFVISSAWRYYTPAGRCLLPSF